jgi:enamine deaminase RidA (YjgF/YER057c/UK114 family)
MNTPDIRLAELGITLPVAAEEVAAYEASTRAGSLLWISGQLPMVDDVLLETGKVGNGPDQISPERAAELARVCAINALAAVVQRVGSLDRVRSIPKVLAFVASDPSFTSHSAVVNGFSTLLTDVLGEAGKHARSAIGVASLPLGSPIEIEAIFEIA